MNLLAVVTLTSIYQIITGQINLFGGNSQYEQSNKMFKQVVQNHQSELKYLLLFSLLLDRYPCPYSVLIVGWWCSSSQT